MTLFQVIQCKHLPTWMNSICNSKTQTAGWHNSNPRQHYSTKTGLAAVRQKRSNSLSCLIPHGYNCGTVCCASAGTGGVEAHGLWHDCCVSMVCRGTLISVSGYCLCWPQKGQKGHMTLETYPVTMPHFCFLTAVSLWCCYLYLHSYSAVSWHMGQLSVSVWFFLFTAEWEWSSSVLLDSDCVEY